jgi:Flp pilus assembly protein TadD
MFKPPRCTRQERQYTAIAKSEKALLAHPNDRHILAALASFHQARGENAAASRYAERLRTLDNENANEWQVTCGEGRGTEG